MSKQRWMVLLAIICLVALLVPVTVSAAWEQDGENWRYQEDGWYYQYGMYEIDGEKYYFEDGLMVADDIVWNDGNYYYADAKGILHDTGWFYVGNYWYYLHQGERMENGVHEIGGQLYGFDWDGHLYTVGGEQEIESYNGDYWEYNEYYVTESSGVLYRNTWRYREITYPYEIGWVYYGDDGQMIQDAAVEIGGVWYAFDYDGVMLEDCVFTDETGVYFVSESGAATKLPANTWREDGSIWYYTMADGTPAQGAQNVGGVTYYFESGRMYEEDWAWCVINDVEGQYLFDESGALVTKTGWVQLGGNWFLVKEDGTLFQGWLYEGGQWYYLNPAMRHDTVFFDEGDQKNYYANGKGICTAVSGSGLTWFGNNLYYFEDGKVVSEAWRQIGGNWYYFDIDAGALKNGSYTVDEARYLFDENGKMLTGWQYKDGSWMYADASGALATGLQTIDGVKYYFSSWGEMYENTMVDGYIVNADGAVVAEATGTGWKQVGSDWYYSNNGHFVSGTVMEIGGQYYAFDYEGKMLSGGIKMMWGDRFYISNSGEILTGWHEVNGKWIYADKDGYPSMAFNGVYYIDDHEYAFDSEGFMLSGSFTLNGYVYTTEANGAIKDSKEAGDGWFVQYNNWYYTKNGDDFTGWVGDYYIENGRMLFCTTVEYNGQLYYLQGNGLCLRDGWLEIYEDEWILAKADGSLYCSTWAQVGGKWYYFNGYTMVYGDIFFIDEEYHKFDENGAWLGEYDLEEIEIDADLALGYEGWQLIGGKWYYYYCGRPVTGGYYIDGNYYFFDYFTAQMVSDGFAVYSYRDIYTELLSNYYYGANGAAVAYTGWQMIDGQWYFFRDNHMIKLGVLEDSNGYYYATWDDEEGYKLVTLGGTGWHQVGEDWFYLHNGTLAEGYREIGGVGYYFNNGVMLTDTIRYVNGYERYFGSDGAMLTAEGWHQVNNGADWTYINEHGEVYYHGVYKIDGVYYAFNQGLWVA